MPGESLRGLRCIRCGGRSPLPPVAYLCGSCGGNQLVEYDLARVRRSWSREALRGSEVRSIWRYAPVLPVAAPLAGPPVGDTPLVPAPRLARALGLQELFVKDEGRNPSASLKDRASAVALARARDAGHDLVVAASTGNAAAATALLAAANGMRARIFVPRSAPRAKVAQLVAFGAEVYAVDGTYDDAFELSLAATARFGWYNRNTGHNPFTREGKKTVAYELAEQLGFRAPDLVVVPVGDGNIISGVWKGFTELAELGFIERRPRLLAVQAEGSAAVVRAITQGGAIVPVRAATLADSIAVDVPRDGEAAVAAVRESGGTGVLVSDDAILRAIPSLARGCGVFAEPAGAAAYAGLEQALREGLLARLGTVVVLATGSGLKDVAAAMRTTPEPRVVPAGPGALDALFPAA